jgi:pyrroloquinoline quinone (PQQ) biosynthesis protein C
MRSMEALEKIRARVRDDLNSTYVLIELLAGRFDLDLYRVYLCNAWYYAQHSSEFMAAGGGRCGQSHPALSRYLLHHAVEEMGHEKWAEADLADLDVSAEQLRGTRPLPSTAALVGYVHWLAHAGNPVTLFGWMFVLEAVGNDIGQAAAAGLKSELEVPSAVRFVAGHAMSDVGHTAEIVEQIDTHLTDASDRDDVVASAEVVADLYTRMFHEIGEARH